MEKKQGKEILINFFLAVVRLPFAYSIFTSMSHTATMWQAEPPNTKKWKTECMYRALRKE